MTGLPLGLDLLLIAAFAGYTASFACVVLERRLVGEAPDGRSRCVCGTPIPMYRNIPVVSWVLQRGRAACCGARIPTWYVGAESVTVGAALVGALLAGAVVEDTTAWRWVGALIGTAVAVGGVAAWHGRTRSHVVDPS